MTITIQQPKPFDIVGDPVLFAGFGQGFEAVFSWRVHDGHDERTGSINAGGGTGEHGQYQVAAAIGAAAFQLDRIFVEVFEESASVLGFGKRERASEENVVYQCHVEMCTTEGCR